MIKILKMQYIDIILMGHALAIILVGQIILIYISVDLALLVAVIAIKAFIIQEVIIY